MSDSSNDRPRSEVEDPKDPEHLDDPGPEDLDDLPERPTITQPLNAPRRTFLVPGLIVLGLLLIGALFWFATEYVRYHAG